jgi:glycine C-acetyltransferase/8-amino-7-oxononanoate synthase
MAMRVCEAALERGVFAQAIRPPTVPEGTSRLRLAVMATHTKDELREAARVLGRAALIAGFRPATAMPVAFAQEAAHAASAPRAFFDLEVDDAVVPAAAEPAAAFFDAEADADAAGAAPARAA